MRPFPEISAEYRSAESEQRDRRFAAELEASKRKCNFRPDLWLSAVGGAVVSVAVFGSTPTWQTYGIDHPHCCVGRMATLWELIADLPRVLQHRPAKQVFDYYSGYLVASVLLLFLGGAVGWTLGAILRRRAD